MVTIVGWVRFSTAPVAQDPDNHNLLQIIDVNDGMIRWVNADLVSHILHSLDGLHERKHAIDD